MPGRDIIVIGASAGGLPALTELVRGLPEDLPAAVFVVVHTSPSSPGILPSILDRAGALPVSHAANGTEILHGQIYVAPPDHHMLIKDGTIGVAKGPKENGFRPAVDPLFRTAARIAGPRAVGIVLSGGLDDGTEGLALIKKYGGTAIVQDPEEADFPSMPASAIANCDVDHVLGVSEMPALLVRLAREPIPEGVLAMAAEANGKGRRAPDVAEIGDTSLLSGDLPGPPSGFTCPECGGALWELQGGRLVKYRCHVGHSYTAEGLVAEQTRSLEVALWTGLRALEEYAALRRRMARRAKSSSWGNVSTDYEQQAEEAEARASLIRTVLIDNKLPEPRGKSGSDTMPLRPKWDGRLYGAPVKDKSNGRPRQGENGTARGRKTSPDGRAAKAKAKATPKATGADKRRGKGQK